MLPYTCTWLLQIHDSQNTSFYLNTHKSFLRMFTFVLVRWGGFVCLFWFWFLLKPKVEIKEGHSRTARASNTWCSGITGYPSSETWVVESRALLWAVVLPGFHQAELHWGVQSPWFCHLYPLFEVNSCTHRLRALGLRKIANTPGRQVLLPDISGDGFEGQTSTNYCKTILNSSASL